MTSLSFLVSSFMAMALVVGALGQIGGHLDAWGDGRATFYGDIHGSETMYGACGYGNLFEQGYGLETTALSTALFNNGATCGACFELYCVHSKWCIKGAGGIRVTATNFCPPSSTSPNPWCNPPQKHFDLSQYMFLKFAIYQGGVVPVKFRRVYCYKKGGMKFEIKGNPYWILVLVYNVGGLGMTDWIQMQRNWGQNWETGVQLVGQGLSFQVTTSDGRMVQSDNIVPTNWEFGQTFEGRNF
ncbi:hypothetical protein AAG906_040667 [Vitis piasezkii]